MKKDKLHKNNRGFKVPENYFDSFEDRLAKAISSEEKENLIPNTKTASGFKVPENYFDNFDKRLEQHIATERNKGKVITLFSRRNMLYLSGIAAMIAIIISLSIDKKTQLDFNAIQIADIHEYITEGNIELSDQEIASLFEEDINYTASFEEEIVNEEELLEYISEEDLTDEIIFVE
ncbi:hypothetical protein M0D21_15765 [Aquimarina sp. D1M17]|uniref:hypothetical protein n=1 Tax=Aquimarina acroporae TaxID=2937283 RepID=UPI0020BE132D|nr:hypothetical protein [Aquimarina acroporae]MCK8523035.1 hypothetical protein [Aquimarina acroporae]